MADTLIKGVTLVEKYSKSMGEAPIGSIVAWLKSFTGVPTLPEGWLECDGSTINDPNSYLHGQTLPDLNGDNRFLRGNSTSGGTGGTATHTHTGPSHTHTFSTSDSGSTGSESSHTHSFSDNVTMTANLDSIGGGSGTIYGNDDGNLEVSGTTGAGSSHSHTFSTSDSGTTGAGGTGATGSSGTLPTYYNVVWIMRVR